MDAMDALRTIIADSGLTHRQIARRLNKYDTYVSQTLSRATTPHADTLASIARACGYDLCLVPRDGGTTITIGDLDDAGATDDDAITQARALIHRAATLLDSIE